METIFLGSYWQSNHTEKEPIEWLVLRENEDSMYVLSKYCLDCIPYCEGRKIAWKNSFMRKWLNETFFNNAFSEEEKDRIILSNVKTESGGWFGPWLDSGPAVKDKVFLPSIAEAILYFGAEKWNDIEAEQRRIARPTKYAYEKGCVAYPLSYGVPEYSKLFKSSLKNSSEEEKPHWHFDGEPHFYSNGDVLEEDDLERHWGCSWFLRSSGTYLIRVDYNGTIEDNSWALRRMFFGNEAIRPAMWIKK